MKDYKDLIAKLRGTKSQSKRKMLDDAADAIESLQRQLAHKEEVRQQQARTIKDFMKCRTEGCEYCREGRYIPLPTDVGETWIEGNLLVNGYGDCVINCCPMCGKLLEN